MYAVWEHNWFPAVRLNWTENILYTADLKSGARTKLHKEDNRIAIIEIKEDGIRREITWGQLRALTKEFTAALKHHGVVPGDRVAVVAGNSLDTILVMLATVALGAIFSSCSTDMGVKGILDRLTQIRPKWVFADDVTLYKGVKTDLREKMTEVVRGIVDGKVEEFQGIISIPRFGEEGAKDVTEIPKAILLQDFLSATTGNKETRSEQTFEQFPFNHPFLIVYSSGTTGPPKCILHSIGGCILNNYKESQLHRSIRPSHSRILQFTTTAWIMFLTGPSSLLVGASVVLYDGSPMHPRLTSFLELVGQESVTHWGTSPRYLQELEHNRISASNLPGNLSLSTLEVVTSTGMVLSDALFEWFYSPRSGFSPNVHLDNISGGTDIAGGFAVGNPLDPVYTGGCQGLSLGIPVEVYDPAIEPGPNVQGRALPSGQPGELVAVSPFPNMPIAFWSSNHQDPTINLTESRTKYFNSYFAKYANVWTHGDFILIHPLTNQVFILGRADGVLNPSGVRFGSSDIYSVLEKHFADDVEDSVCVGQRRAGRDTDERVLLFLLMRRSSPSPSPSPSTARSRQARPFSRSLIQDIKRTIGNELSKRHIPAYIFQTPEIPVCSLSYPLLITKVN